MILFISTDYQDLDSRLKNILNLEFFNNNITKVITTSSSMDSFIRKLCITKGVEFSIFDMGYRYDERALELLVKDTSKFIILSQMYNSFYLQLFKVNESFVPLADGFKYPTKEVKKKLMDNYKERIAKGHNISIAYDEEVSNKLSEFKSTPFLVYRREI